MSADLMPRYRQYAETCIAIARDLEPARRITILEMAQTWLRIERPASEMPRPIVNEARSKFLTFLGEILRNAEFCQATRVHAAANCKLRLKPNEDYRLIPDAFTRIVCYSSQRADSPCGLRRMQSFLSGNAAGIRILQISKWLRRHPSLGYAAAFATVGLAAAVQWLAREQYDGVPFLTIYPAVILTALIGGLGAGLLAAALAGLSQWGIFIPRVHWFALSSYAFDAVVCVLLIVLINRTFDGDEAIAPLNEALHLSPRDQFNFLWPYLMGSALFVAGRYQEALECLEKSLRENSGFPGVYRLRTACLSQLGRVDEAKAALADFLRLVPDATVATTKAQIPLKRPEDLERYVEALKRAGLRDS